MKRRFLWFGLVVVVVMALLLWPRLRNGDARAGGPPAGAGAGATGGGNRPVQVDAVLADTQSLSESIRTTGSILANEEVNVTSESAGRVTALPFQEGGRVRKGQVLVQLNDAEVRASLRRAQERAKLLAAQEYRQRILLDKQAVSQQEYDVVAADLAIARADVDLINTQLDRMRIVAPFDGTIGLRQIAVGSYVTPGSGIATLQNLDQVKLEFAVPEKYAERVRPGAKVSFQVRNSSRKFLATVFAIEPRIETATRTLLVRAKAANPGGDLVPGSFADIDIILGQSQSTIVVPATAIVPQQDKQVVYVVRDGKAAAQPVRTGTRLSDRVAVEEGLEVGDTIIITGLQSIRPGVAVTALVAQ